MIHTTITPIFLSSTAAVTDAGSRLDSFMARQHPTYSRGFFQELITQGKVRINGTIASKSSIALKDQDKVEVIFTPHVPSAHAPLKSLEGPCLQVKLIYEHEHFLIIDKPAGLLVHPPHLQSTELTLVDWLIQNHPELRIIGHEERPGIIHRLDKDTSGLLIVPRTPYGFMNFGSLFRNRLIAKTYIAVVEGTPQEKGTIDLPIGRSITNPSQMAAFEYTAQACGRKIRASVTHYKVLQTFPDYSLMELRPVTGRTHQIRVHMKAIGHPLVGDATYGKSSFLIKRHALHAHQLSFEFDGTPYTFISDLPIDMMTLIKT